MLSFLAGLGLEGSECEGEGATILTADEDGLEKNDILRPKDDGVKQTGSLAEAALSSLRNAHRLPSRFETLLQLFVIHIQRPASLR